MPEITHDIGTLYNNVILKNGYMVMKHELNHIAMNWWCGAVEGKETSPGMEAALEAVSKSNYERKEFAWFRAVALSKLMRLAGLALASDFTPRRIAVQLSNDLYRFMVPQMKLRGITIETEIEYRVGAYFVLGVNINEIDWITLMRHTHRFVKD